MLAEQRQKPGAGKRLDLMRQTKGALRLQRQPPAYSLGKISTGHPGLL